MEEFVSHITLPQAFQSISLPAREAAHCEGINTVIAFLELAELRPEQGPNPETIQDDP